MRIAQLTVKLMPYKISVLIEKDRDGYYAYCPELEGCQSQGNSYEEVVENIKEAIELYIETLSDEEIQTLIKKEVSMITLEVKVA